MSTSATNPLSSGTSGSSATAPQYFTGLSNYSSDFQSIISRAVSIAQIPLQQLQAQQATELSKKQGLITLNPFVNNVATDLGALGTLAANQALSASSSDAATVSVQSTGATTPATYSIANIQSLARAASETSTKSYSDSTSAQASQAGNLSLVVGNKTYTLNLTSQTNNLAGLEAAINQSGAPVTASILTTGTNVNYLSVTANATGATTLQLLDNAPSGSGPGGTTPAPVNLLSSANQGANAQFDLNGVSINRSTNTVNDVIPGLSFTLESATNSSTPVTLSLQTDPTQLSSALNTFVTDYNSLVAQVAQQQGTSGGPLVGETIISQISDDLRQLTTYYAPSSAGGVQSLSDLGIKFNTTGQLSFAQSTFSALSSSQITSAFKFLGSSTSGFAGFTHQFTQLGDPVSGLILSEENGLDAEGTQLSDQISRKTAQVAALQARITSQVQKADALVAQLQSERSVLSASIQSVDLALYGQQNVSY